ncbi:MAG: Txe/YoeB family addiction module toxin [Bacteroidales bacterium]|nr:Txe/YoeB family addiction module toxin [Bacteroidales bacterium]MDE7103377.1 Txe/YoeB family addiction module toxin [Bacteroidales bacterium]
MEIILLEQAKKDVAYWKQSGNKAVMKKISALLKDIQLHPYSGIGKPEALKYGLQGKWSRRITAEHRLVYSVDDQKIIIYVLSMRYHYC